MDNIQTAMTDLENSEAEIECGLDAINVLCKHFFGDGTESAFKKALYVEGKEGFEETSNALCFIVSMIRHSLDKAYEATDRLLEAVMQSGEEGTEENVDTKDGY